MPLLLVLLPTVGLRGAVWAELERSRFRVVFSPDPGDCLLRLVEVRPDAALVPFDGVDEAWLDAARARADIPIVSYGPAGGSDLSVDAHLRHLDDLGPLESAIAGEAEVEPDALDAATVVGFENPFAERRTDPSGSVSIERVPRPLDELPTPAKEPTPAPDPATELRFEPPIRAPTSDLTHGLGLDESQLGLRMAERIRTVHARMAELTDAQLLGVEPGAPPERIEQAWFDLAVELHPDRLFMLGETELQAQSVEIFDRLESARKRLSGGAGAADPDTYADGLGLRVDPRIDTTWADRAEDAFERGAFHDARFNLRVLLAHEPKNPSVIQALRRVEDRLRAAMSPG